MKFTTAEMYNNNQPGVPRFKARPFTPEEEEDAFNKAEAEWEEGLRKYEERLKEIDHLLPESVKKFMATVHLHDADFDIWTNPASICTLQLVIRQRDWGDWKYICVLRYKLAAPTEIKINDGPGFYRPTFDPMKFSKPVTPAWLYDEWDHLGTFDTFDGRQEVFSHSFLLSNGVEYNISFTEFEFMFVPLGEGFVES